MSKTQLQGYVNTIYLTYLTNFGVFRDIFCILGDYLIEFQGFSWHY
jgi:hypothetical protein